METSPTFLTVRKTTIEQSKVNAAYIHPSIPHEANDLLVIDSSYLFAVATDGTIPRKEIALSKSQREFLNKGVSNDQVEIAFLSKEYVSAMKVVKFSVAVVSICKIEIMEEELRNRIREVYTGFPFNQGQSLYLELAADDSTILVLRVEELDCGDNSPYGILEDETDIALSTESSRITLTRTSPLTRKDFSLSELGIGGLKQEFEQLFRRAFVQRLFEPEVISKFGLNHVKGIMLYGPPGTGKTLIARKLGSLLNARPPKIVNGPEILNKYVGQSEENIRNLFKDAEAEYKAYGAKSQLHIIIFDEIDAICRRRGTGGSSGAGDQVVNQLLSKFDGVEALDNILVVGMTNRLDMIDEALLRPGRFEIHLEISLPDETARYEIFEIHTRKMTQNSLMDSQVDLKELAALSKNYTGAEIAAVVRSGTSFALERQIELRKAHSELVAEQVGEEAIQVAKNNEQISVTMDDMLRALDEINPAFGMDEADFFTFQKIFYETQPLRAAMTLGRSVFGKLRSTNLYRTTSILFYGENGTGKTTLAVRVAKLSGFPFVKIISPKHLVGLSEYEKINYIKSRFMDAYKSEEACVILDDLEGMIEFVNLGTRFSNGILQALKLFVKNEDRNKLCVLGTTSMPEVLGECGLFESFVESCPVGPCAREDYDELCDQNGLFREVPFAEPVPIKKLLAMLPEADLSMK